jgi:hypothetical protein
MITVAVPMPASSLVEPLTSPDPLPITNCSCRVLPELRCGRSARTRPDLRKHKIN